jgi:hypothetical protein
LNPQKKEDQSERVGGGGRGFERTSGGGGERETEKRDTVSPKQIREKERANERVRKRTRLVETRDL